MEDDQFIELINGINEAKILIATNASTLEAVHDRQNNVLSRMLALESHASKVTAIVEEQKLLPRVVSLEGSRMRWSGVMAFFTILLTVLGLFFINPIRDIVNIPTFVAINAERHDELNKKVDNNNKQINDRVDVFQDRFNKLDVRVNNVVDRVDKIAEGKSVSGQ